MTVNTSSSSLTEAPSESATPVSRKKRERRIPGEEGVWVFIFGDMCVFAVLFSLFLVARTHNPDLFRHSADTLNRDFGVVNTLNLLMSSIFVVLAVRAKASSKPWHQKVAPRFVLAAMFFGACFIVVKVVEYSEKLSHGLTPGTNDFYMYYFILTGLHLVHLILGMGVLTLLWRLAKKPELGKFEKAFFEGGACFWHMVDLLWIVLFPLLYLVR